MARSSRSTTMGDRASSGCSMRSGGAHPLTYYVFDILELDGRDLRDEPLTAPQGDPAQAAARRARRHPLQRRRRRTWRQGARPGLPPRPRRHRLQAGRQAVRVAPRAELAEDQMPRQRGIRHRRLRVSDKKGRSFASLLLGEFEDGKLHYRGACRHRFRQRRTSTTSAPSSPRSPAQRAICSTSRAHRAATRNGSSRSSWRKSPSRSGHRTAYCAIPRSSACAATSRLGKFKRKR